MKTIKIKQANNMSSIQNQLYDDLKTYLTDDVNVIVTNGNLSAVLQDSCGYELNHIKDQILNFSSNEKPKLYNTGSFEKIQLMVDPYMKWDDNRFILMNEEVVVEEIEVVDGGFLLI